MGDVEILRIVVRENLSEDMIDLLVHDVMEITESLMDTSSSDAQLAATSMEKIDHKHSTAHKSHPRHPHKYHSLEPGSGTKPTGYAKQC